jgi:hypothetical protein
LPTLDDPRQAKKIKHKLAVVLLFGLLCFVFQMSSRRQANVQMTQPLTIRATRTFPVNGWLAL